MIILARDVLPSDEVMKLVRVRDKIPARGALTSLSEIRDINRQLICSLQELDRWILANFSTGFSREPYIVLDDRRRTVTYLGVEISFDDFSEGNALGGLKVLRILVQHPGQWLSTRDLLNQSKISSDLPQITAYLSRLRNVLRRYEERWWNAVQNSVEYSKSRQGFIIPDRGRRPDVGEGAWYKLDLPSFRVRFVSADDR